jgi:DNA-directed RNA polymerase subunit L
MDVKVLSYTKSRFGGTKLTLEIEGDKVYYPVINSIRKVCMNQIPTYAFHKSQINITKDTSVFDRTYMRCRLSQLPITNLNGTIKEDIRNDVQFLSTKYYKDAVFANPDFVKNPYDNQQIEFYMNKKNNGPDEIMNITTDDLIIRINNEIIPASKMYSTEFPVLLCQLRLDEEFECSMKANVATGEFDTIFDTANVYYAELKPNKYRFMMESSGQFTEFEILARGILVLCEKLRIVADKLLNKNYNSSIIKNNVALFEIVDEDYTCGGILNYCLQNMDDVIYSGIAKPTFMEKKILIKVITNGKLTPIEAFVKGTEDAVRQLMEFKKKVDKLEEPKAKVK